MLFLTSHTTVYDLFKNQKNTDVRFICSDGEIGAHGIMLKANSQWFQNNSASTIILVESTRKNVSDFLEIIYTGKADFGNENLPIKKLLDFFQCSFHIKEPNQFNNLNVISNQNGNMSPASGSPVFLLPNQFAQIVTTSPVTNRITEVTNPNMSELSPSSVAPEKNLHHNSKKSQETCLTNSQSSSSSDICFMEASPPLVEITDTLTEHFEPIMTREIKVKRKYDDNSRIESDIISSDDTDIDVLTVESSSKRKKADHRRVKKNNQIQSESVSEDSETNIPIRRKILTYQVKNVKKTRNVRQKNRFNFDTSDDESEQNTKVTKDDVIVINSEPIASTSNTTTKAMKKVMEYKFLEEVEKKLMTYCVICADYYPDFNTHIKRHQLSSSKCPHCSKKFSGKKCLNVHLRVCKNIN